MVDVISGKSIQQAYATIVRHDHLHRCIHAPKVGAQCDGTTHSRVKSSFADIGHVKTSEDFILSGKTFEDFHCHIKCPAIKCICPAVFPMKTTFVQLIDCKAECRAKLCLFNSFRTNQIRLKTASNVIQSVYYSKVLKITGT